MAFIQVLEKYQVAYNKIRLRFSKPVPYMALNENQSTSALLTSNYKLSLGATPTPIPIPINRILTVPDRYDHVDIETVSALAAGSYTIQVSGLRNWLGETLENDLQTYTVACVYMPVSENIQQNSIEYSLRRYLSPILEGPNFRAILTALATGEVANKDNLRSAQDQMFLTTASGHYLDRNAASYGISRPNGLGMSDAAFREYCKILYNFKVNEDSLYRMIKVFYGIDGVQAYVENNGPLPAISVNDGDYLILKMDGNKTVTITFFRNEFDDYTNPQLTEAAVLISRKLQEQRVGGFSIIKLSDIPSPSTPYLRIYSATMGLRSSVEVVGGTAMPWLYLTPRKAKLNVTGGASFMSRDDTETLRIFLHAISEQVFRTPATAAFIAPNSSGTGYTGWCFDPSNRFALTAVETLLSQDMHPGGYYSEIAVSDASQFSPTGGYLAIGFGYDYQQGPIKYISTSLGTTPNKIRLDPNFQLTQAIYGTTSNVYVTALNGNAGYLAANLNQPVGVNSGINGSLYATNSNLARIVCARALLSMLDAGSKHSIQTIYPSPNGLLNAGSPFENSSIVSDIVRIYGPNEEVY